MSLNMTVTAESNENGAITLPCMNVSEYDCVGHTTVLVGLLLFRAV